ncbi:PAS domain S-box protein [Haloarculaceae archaeon H-GB11]|nr:PAS domain S-box protein [Haloarculaceae archaeon H-GB11]
MTQTEHNNSRFEAICQASPDALLLVDVDGRITFANERVRDLFGYDPEELVGERVELLVPDGIGDDHVAMREAYFADPETRPMGASLDLLAQRKDGSTVPVDISLSPVESERPEVVVAVRDVSEQEALRAKYRKILQSVPDAVVVAETATGEIVEVNERVIDLFGYEPSELVGMTQSDLHPHDEAGRYEALFEHHVSAGERLISELPDGSDVYVETKAGARVPVEINARVFELGGQERIVGIFRDVSARKDRERTLEGLQRAAQRLLAATNREEVATIVSETAASVFDWEVNSVHLFDDERDALVPAEWTDAVAAEFDGPPPSIPAGDGIAWEAFAREEVAVAVDLRDAVTPLAADTDVRSQLVVPLGDHGVLVVCSYVPDDFDESAEALAKVLAAHAAATLDRVERECDLEAQNERLEQFTSVVSHDLRNPLNTAQGRLDVLEAEYGEDEERDHLAVVGTPSTGWSGSSTTC